VLSEVFEATLFAWLLVVDPDGPSPSMYSSSDAFLFLSDLDVVPLATGAPTGTACIPFAVTGPFASPVLAWSCDIVSVTSKAANSLELGGEGRLGSS